MNKPRALPSNLQTPRESGAAESIEMQRAEERRRDEELVRRAQSDDMSAFDELVTHYRGKIYAMIVNMIRNDAEAWDLSQEVFIKAWKALPKFEARAGFYTWLYRIAHNVTFDWMRKKRITGGAEFDDTVAMDAEAGALTSPKPRQRPDERLENEELGGRIREAISELSEDHRAVILLKEVDGLRYQEIADVLECSIGTVMSRLYYARKKLQEKLKDLRP